MQNKKLYKRDNTGNIRVWWAEINEGSYRLHSGQLEGKLITSDWTSCVGKNVGRSNATTNNEQARAEVDSLYTKKKKRGYTEDPKAIDQVKKALVGVMLAHDYADHKHKLNYDKGIYCQPKLDGIRCIARPDGLWTRKGEPILTVPHIAENIIPICIEYNYVFDGELYNHDLRDDFNEIASLVRRQKTDEKQRAKVRDIVQYHTYDLVDQGMCFNDRRYYLRDLFKHNNRINEDFIKRVTTSRCKNPSDLDILYEHFVEEGYEGQMVRMNTPYEFKRTASLLKRKEWVDDEFKVLDIFEGKGNRSGMVGSVLFKTKEGKEFTAALEGTNATRKQVLADKHLFIGCVATVKFFHYTPDGKPRFPSVKYIEPR